MEAEQVIEKILTDARAQAEKIKKESEEKQAAEQAKSNQQLSEHKKQTDTLAQKAAEDKKMHLLAAARMDIAKQHLTEKRKILDEVFDQAREQLQNLPDDEYRQLMTKLMLEAVETGDEEVIVDTNESRINQDLIDQVNARLNDFGKGNLTFSDQRQDIGAGFILKHERIKTNVSLQVLLAQARKQLEIELANDLFGDTT
jgi:V/A-type H+-transporting ATPase subunit E